MSEEETRIKGQRPEISGLSFMSFILSVVGLYLSTIGAYAVGRVSLTWGWLYSCIILFAALSISILSLIIGSIGLKKIKQSNGFLSGYKFVYYAQFIAIITIIWIGCVFFGNLGIMLYGIGPHS
jgi:hypothetical protein